MKHNSYTTIINNHQRPLISIVISAYNEEGNIHELYNQMIKYLHELQNVDYEFLFVNDGSKDLTAAKVLQLQDSDDRVKLVNLTRNFGHELAMTAGMDAAKGQAVIFMDADLQHPPQYLIQMITLWQQGYEMVLTKRTKTKTSIVRKIANSLYYKALETLSDIEVPRNTPDFRLIDRKYIEMLKKIEQKERMFRGLLNFVGLNNYIMIEFEAPARFSGITKYNFFSTFSLAINGILQFSTKPLRLITFFGLFLAALSIIFAGYILFERIFHGTQPNGFATIIILMSVFFTTNVIISSILGEYIGRIHLESKSHPLYFANIIEKKDR